MKHGVFIHRMLDLYSSGTQMERLVAEQFRAIVNSLYRFSTVKPYGNLWSAADEIMGGDFKEFGPFDFIVTQFPFNDEPKTPISYSKSAHSISALDEYFRRNFSSPKFIFLTGGSGDSKLLMRHLIPDCHILSSGAIGMGGPDAVIESLNQILSEHPKHVDNLVERFIQKLDPRGKLSGEETDFIAKEIQQRARLSPDSLSEIIVSDRNFTSRTGFVFKDKFIKVDLSSRLKPEYSAYCMELSVFSNFRANLNPSEFVASDSYDLAIIAMDNLLLYERGFVKMNKLFGTQFNKHDIFYNLFLMSVFHREAGRHKGSFEPVVCAGVHGLSHVNEGITPFLNVSGEGWRRFSETKVDTAKVVPVVDGYNHQKKLEAGSVIHGDWKEDNVVNGHLVDFAMVGLGFEVDELAYYLSDARFGFGLEQFHGFVDDYIRFRSSQDVEFSYRVNEGYGQQMHKIADAAFLSQLVLRHSVMNKRDMMDDSKFRQRQYYKYMVEKVAKEGRFV